MLPMVLWKWASIALGEFSGNSIILGLFFEREKSGCLGKAKGMLEDNEIDVGKTKDNGHRVEVGWLA